MIAREPERRGVIELEVWLVRLLLFPCNRPPANENGSKYNKSVSPSTSTG
jgi:hypothetical protein